MKKIIIAILLISSLALSSCFGWDKNSDNNSSNNTEVQLENWTSDTSTDSSEIKETENLEEKIEREEEEQSKEEQLNREREKYQSFENIVNCWALIHLEVECRDYFYFKSGVSALSEKTCNKISDERKRKFCLDKVSAELAVTNTDTKSCSSIENVELSENCYTQTKEIIQAKAQTKKDVSVLKRTIFNDSISANACSWIEDKILKDKCADSKVIEDLDISICNDVYDDADEILSCKSRNSYTLNNKILLMVFTSKDKSHCNKSTSKDAINKCMEIIL